MAEHLEKVPVADQTQHFRQLLTVCDIKTFNAAHKTARKDNPEFSLDLTGLKLNGADLRRINLEMANFGPLDFLRINFRGSKPQENQFFGS